MSDLISRAAVIEVLEECHLDKQLFEKEVYDKINAIPTAYNVDKVMEELEENQTIVFRLGCIKSPIQSIDYERAIDIVKRGGVSIDARADQGSSQDDA